METLSRERITEQELNDLLETVIKTTRVNTPFLVEESEMPYDIEDHEEGLLGGAEESVKIETGSYMDYVDWAYKRTAFIRDLTRELFLERAKSNPSGKIPTDYAKTAHDGAVSVADVLGLVD